MKKLFFYLYAASLYVYAAQNYASLTLWGGSSVGRSEIIARTSQFCCFLLMSCVLICVATFFLNEKSHWPRITLIYTTGLLTIISFFKAIPILQPSDQAGSIFFLLISLGVFILSF
jgi:hypothetical protein